LLNVFRHFLIKVFHFFRRRKRIYEQFIDFYIQSVSHAFYQIQNWVISGATSYKVYYGYSEQQNPSSTTTVTTTSYEKTSLIFDSTYYYKVSAVNSAGEGTASSVVSAKTNKFGTPGIPTGVTAAPLSSSSIQITWLSPSGTDKATGYIIYRSTVATGTFPSIANTSSLTYTDTGLNPSTTYYYFVVATNSYGDGSVSSTSSATTTAASSGGGGSGGGSGGGGTTPTVPSAPTGVTASRDSTTPTTVKVSWNAVSGATSYKIYYSSSNSGTGTPDGTSTTTSYNSTGNNANSTWYFRVTAVNSAGEGTSSSWVSVGPATSGGGSGGYGTIKVENGGLKNIGIYLNLIESSGNTLVNSTTADAGVTKTFSSVPAGKTYRITVMEGLNTYNSNTFTLSANETVNVMWTGLTIMIY
jgi:fibronectin type 3 domain-containing protein